MKKIICFLLSAAFFFLLSITVSAETDYVFDDADLMTNVEEADFDSQIEEIKAQYGVDIVLHTTMSIGNTDIYSYSENFYTSRMYSEDGIIFVINLNNNKVGMRDFYTYYQGSVYDTFGYDAYDSEIGYINEQILPYLIDGDYASAFGEYLSLTESYLSGEISYDYENIPESDYDWDEYYYDDYYPNENNYQNENLPLILREIIVIAIGVAAAFIITAVMKGKMNTASIKTEASGYMTPGSLNITKSLDIYTHRHVTKTPIPKNNTNSSHSAGTGGHSVGGGGGGSRSGGGGGKF